MGCSSLAGQLSLPQEDTAGKGASEQRGREPRIEMDS